MAALATTRQRVQHLLRRGGLGYSPAELDHYLGLGLEGAVDRLLHPEQIDDSTADAAIAALNVDLSDKQQRQGLFQTWYLRMLLTERPLLERMTYFWHDHFATAISKVQIPQLMQDQNDTLRRHALGSFYDMLLAVARDPAMLVWLDNRSNSRSAPNENYARELMELHTLGHDNGYTEKDIKEAARALTGWRLTGAGPVFRAQLHDGGIKTVLGRTGRFNDAGVIAVLASDRGTAHYVSDKLVRFLVRPDSEPSLVLRAADTYMATKGDIRQVLRVILLSEEMYSDAAYRSIIKSPVDLIIGARRALEASSDGATDAEGSRRMGQLLYDPPNPAGWTGGPDWLNAATMLARANYANDLTLMRGKHAADIAGLFSRYGATSSAAQVVDWLLDLLVGGDIDAETRSILIEHIGGQYHFDFQRVSRDGSLHGMAYLALSMPLYQLA